MFIGSSGILSGLLCESSNTLASFAEGLVPSGYVDISTSSQA